MTSTAPTPATRSAVRWIVPAAVLTVVAIGVLWALPRPAEVCIAIYPTPPECLTGGDPSGIIPFLVLLVLLLAAYVACTLLVPVSRRPLVLGLLAGASGLVFLVGLVTTLTAANSAF